MKKGLWTIMYCLMPLVGSILALLAAIALWFDTTSFNSIVGSFYRLWWTFPLLFWGAFSIDNFIDCLYWLSQSNDCEASFKNNHCLREITGAPGTGKSTKAVVLFYFSVMRMQAKLRIDTYINELRSKKAKWLQNDVFLASLAETRQANEYYSNSPFVSCAFSNLPIKINGQYTHKYTADHANGTLPIPPYSVEFVDEASGFFPTTTHKDRIAFWLTDARYKRQQLKESYLLEQERDNINKDIRRVLGVNEEMIGRSERCAPYFLLMLRDLTASHFCSKNIKHRYITNMIDFLDYCIKKIGFVVWDSVELAGAESKAIKEPEEKRFVALKDIPVEFDSRAFRNLPQARQEPEIDGWDNLIIDKDSKEAEQMRRNLASILEDVQDVDK